MTVFTYRNRPVYLMCSLVVVSFVAGAFSLHRGVPQLTRRPDLRSNRKVECIAARDKAPEVLISKEDLSEANVDTDILGENATTSELEVAEKPKQKSIVGLSFLFGLTIVSGLAKFGILRGALDAVTGEYAPYTNGMIGQDIGLTLMTAVLGYALVKLITLGYENEIYGSNVSRKLSHTLSAPLFMLFFPFFSAADGSRFFAALVILTNIIRLYLAGAGFDPSLANSVSRSGDKSEVLGGPFIYVCLFQAFTLLFWRTSVVGVIAMSTMAAGDGMADLVGRKWGRNNKWWFSEDKSVAGTVAFAISSTLTSYGLVQLFMTTGFYQSPLAPLALLLQIAGISVVCSMIELLPFGDDNYTVPISAAILTALLLQ
jgi:dolichol kinase/tetrahydromethanopterin S-methyltransferase subunit G